MKHALTLMTLLACQAVQPAMAHSDDFNHCGLKNSKWILLSGSLHIANCSVLAAGDETQVGPSLAIFRKADAGDHVGTMDVMFSGSEVQFAAIALGDIANGNNAYVKVQSQNGLGTISHIGFYVSNNDGRGGRFFQVQGLEGISAARITAKVHGGLVKLMIDTNFDGIPERSYGYRFSRNFPHGVGVGLYGAAQADNFKSGGYAPRAALGVKVQEELTDDLDLTQ